MGLKLLIYVKSMFYIQFQERLCVFLFYVLSRQEVEEKKRTRRMAKKERADGEAAG